MTLLTDRFGRIHSYLRIAVTDRCNLRCRYCMPHEEMIWQERDALLTDAEIERLARLFVSLGVRKIRLTGGEPLLRKNIEALVETLARIPQLETLALTTNATQLAEKVAPLKSAGLQVINISLDTLRTDRFLKITQRDQFHDTLQGIDAALNAGFEAVKLNMVVMGGINDDEVMDFVRLAEARPLNVRFIEYMPFPGNEWSLAKLVPYAGIKAQIEEHYPLSALSNHPSDVGKDFCIPGFAGSVSFVTSMTESFCSGCNRIRLTAEGAIKPCLFDGAEVHLRDALRNGADDRTLTELIRRALLLKPEAHAPVEEINVHENRPMIGIGG